MASFTLHKDKQAEQHIIIHKTRLTMVGHQTSIILALYVTRLIAMGSKLIYLLSQPQLNHN